MGKLAIIQMTSTDKVPDNLRTVNNLIMQAAKAKAEVVVLPENFGFIGMDESDKREVAEHYGEGIIQETISSIAKRLKVFIIAGSIALKQADSDKLWACTLAYDQYGECVARYNKIHMFDAEVSPTESHQESAIFSRGYEPVCVDTPVGRMGLSICYDLRFPELYRKLVEMGAEILAVPSAFTHVTGRAHWETLLRARAIENLAYVVAPNQGGEHTGFRKTYGHSMVVGPWGDIIGSIEDVKPGIAVVDIKLDELKDRREKFPCVSHRVM